MSAVMPAPGEMGVTVVDGVGTIRVYSENATSIQLVIFEPDEVTQVRRTIDLERGEGAIWTATSHHLRPGIKYALSADGPKAPRNAFNNQLFLIDPYARGVVRQNAREYHCVVVDDAFDWQGVSKPNIPLDELIIYEAHARGLTRGNPNLPDELRGTYAALGHPTTIEHLKKIGVNAVELLPIHMFISEPRLMSMGLINYWGYNTINFFSPHPRYASASALKQGPQAVIEELKTSIRELHRNGIEVILDVVYNHTAEGGGGGLTYSYRGLDNSSYYRMDDNGHFHDTTGCGNSLNFGNPHVVHMVLESLRYWTTEMQIDGYRFDLATTIARDGLVAANTPTSRPPSASWPAGPARPPGHARPLAGHHRPHRARRTSYECPSGSAASKSKNSRRNSRSSRRRRVAAEHRVGAWTAEGAGRNAAEIHRVRREPRVLQDLHPVLELLTDDVGHRERLVVVLGEHVEQHDGTGHQRDERQEADHDVQTGAVLVRRLRRLLLVVGSLPHLLDAGTFRLRGQTQFCPRSGLTRVDPANHVSSAVQPARMRYPERLRARP